MVNERTLVRLILIGEVADMKVETARKPYKKQLLRHQIRVGRVVMKIHKQVSGLRKRLLIKFCISDIVRGIIVKTKIPNDGKDVEGQKAGSRHL